MTTMAFGPEVKRLFSRLRRAGYSSAFLNSALPDWWEPDVESEPGLLDELKVDLARRLGLSISALLNADDIRPQLPMGVKFKRAQRIGTEVDEPFVAYCTTLARTIAASMFETSRLPDADSQKERFHILEASNAKWISLNALLRHCWEELNIPVVSVRNIPTNVRGLDAVTFNINQRYIILTAKETKPHAWLAFIIAHELGHIALGHIGDEEVIADHPVIGVEATGEGDNEEELANRYALELLGDDVQFVIGGRSGIPDLESAMEAGKDARVDPGHLILRYARGSGNWEGAQIALRSLHRSSKQPDAPQFINSIARQLLSLQNVAEDARENVLRAMGSTD